MILTYCILNRCRSVPRSQLWSCLLQNFMDLSVSTRTYHIWTHESSTLTSLIAMIRPIIHTTIEIVDNNLVEQNGSSSDVKSSIKTGNLWSARTSKADNTLESLSFRLPSSSPLSLSPPMLSQPRPPSPPAQRDDHGKTH